jgi:hypothetical protein
MARKTAVTIDTREVGQNFGIQGLIRSARTGRILGRTGTYPFDGNAYAAAIRMAEDMGYDIRHTDAEFRVDD